MEEDRNLIVISVDRWGCGYLGPYGNTWLDTPTTCQFAADSTLADFFLADSTDAGEVLTSWWTGRHRWQRRAGDTPSWLSEIARQGWQTYLATDDEVAGRHQLAGDFQHILYHPERDVMEAAASVDDTWMMRTCARWMGMLETLETPFVTWLHGRGMEGPWDAPFEWREQIADPTDPLPPAALYPPSGADAAPLLDPDILWGWTCAYAAQAQVWEECLGMLLRFIDAQPWSDQTTVIVTGLRGFPLGEHGVTGADGDCLHAELIHVPLMVRSPAIGKEVLEVSLPERGRPGAQGRVSQLLQPADAGRWIARGGPWARNLTGESQLAVPLDAALRIADVADAPARAQWCDEGQLPAAPGIERALVVGDSTVGWRSRDWYWIAPRLNLAAGRLYAKPDDRWEVNDVADRAPQVAPVLGSELSLLVDHDP